MDPKVILLFARLTSTLGSVLTAASVPLFLAERGHADWIPKTVVAMALARLTATFGVLPRLRGTPDSRILRRTALFGASALSVFAVVFGLIESFRLFDRVGILFFLALITVATLLGSIDDAVAHSSLGASASAQDARAQRWVHLDSTLFTLARLMAPALAATILALSDARLEWVLGIDAFSYALAFGLYVRFLALPVAADAPSSFNSEDPRANPLWGLASVVREFQTHGQRWWPLLLLGLGASAYNAGIVIHLKAMGWSLGQLSGFMTAQNAAMVGTGLLLTRSPSLSQYRSPATGVAAIGLFLLGVLPGESLGAQGMGLFVLASAAMAFGMVVHLQGLRAELAASAGATAQERRFTLSLFTLLNSGTGIAGALVWTGVAAQVSWRLSLQLAALLILASAGVRALFKAASPLGLKSNSESLR